MVTGGYNLASSEVLHFDGTSMCTLPPMPITHWGHSQSASTVCGGMSSSRTCYTFREGKWETLNDHLELFYSDQSSSWMNEKGDILLMGRGDKFESSHILTGVWNRRFSKHLLRGRVIL